MGTNNQNIFLETEIDRFYGESSQTLKLIGCKEEIKKLSDEIKNKNITISQLKYENEYLNNSLSFVIKYLESVNQIIRQNNKND